MSSIYSQNWAFLLTLTLYGLLFGSFANVVIWRLPRGESLASPGSHCPLCQSRIAWYDNIPLISWLALRGRCRGCRAAIPIRYPIVEALSGVLWLVAGFSFGLTVRTGFAVCFFYLLLILTFIDLDHLRLPNKIVFLLAVIGVVGVAISATGIADAVPLIPLPAGGAFTSPFAYALLGVVAGAGVSGAIAALYSLARGATGLGMGDMKLLATIGLFLGPYSLMVLIVASILGTVVSLFLLRGGARASQTRIPFGPFLAVAAVIVSTGGPALWSWYAGLVGF